MNNDDRLRIAHAILSTDSASISDDVQMDKLNGRPVTIREQTMASVLSSLYRLIHPAFGCTHEDWDEESMKIEERYKMSIENV